MLKYDSVHGRFKHPVSTRKGKLLVEESDNTEIRVYGEKDPSDIPWNETGVEYVIECTVCVRKLAVCAILKNTDQGVYKTKER